MPVEINNPVQCSTATFWAFELPQAMDLMAEAGFSEIELMVTLDRMTQDARIPLRLAEERGLRIASVHAPFLVVTKSVWGQHPIGKIRRGVAMCQELGARCLIVHPPYLWEGDYASWLEEEAELYSIDSGVEVAVETMYPKWVAGRKLRAVRWLEPLELFEAAHRVALDTSHLAVSRADILDAYRLLLPKLAHIHLSDNAGDGKDGHLELEQGILPIERFLNELRRTHYSGSVCLELSVRRYVENPEALVKMLERNRLYVENRLARSARLEKGLPRR